MQNILELYKLGISDDAIMEMVELNPEIKDLDDNEINEKIEILKSINCNDRQIKNIISSNALYLSRLNTDIINLLNRLNSLGFNSLNILIDSNPYILNLDVFEVDNYIDKRLKNGEVLEDIVDDLEGNPSLFLDI